MSTALITGAGRLVRLTTVVLMLAGLGLALAPAAGAVAGLRINGTWNVRATPGGTLVATVAPGPVDVDCQADGPKVTIPGVGASSIWNHIPGRGYVTGLAATGTDPGKRDPRFPTCTVKAPATPAGPSAPGPAGYGSQIVAQAGSWALQSAGGQCKVWAAKVVNAVLARTGTGHIGGYESRGGAYWGSYANAGGIRMTAAQAAPGDLIQLNNPADRTSNVHYRAMHSAIVVARTSTPGTFVVRDSNWHGDERVTEHLWAPATTAARWGLETNYWRFGTGQP